MSTSRIRAGSAVNTEPPDLDTPGSNLATVQAQISSGRRITRSSDDPQGTVRAMHLRAQLTRSHQHAANCSEAVGWLSAAEDTYREVGSALMRARTLLARCLRPGASDGATAAAALDRLRHSLIALANAAHDGRPIFGGTTAGVLAYASDGSYLGDEGTVTRAVDANVNVDVTVPGPAVFGRDADAVFAVLADVACALRTGRWPPLAVPGPPESSAGRAAACLASVDAAVLAVTSALASAGVTQERLRLAQAGRISSDIAVACELADIEDVDLAEVSVEVATADASYRSALRTAAQCRQRSLLDFLG